MNKTYELRTLKDVYDQVPAEKLGLCMREIADGMKYARNLADLMDATAKVMDPHAAAHGMWPEVCTWVDDGKEDKTITVHDAATGEEVFTFEASKSA